MTAQIIDFCRYRAAQRSKARHTIGQAAAAIRFQSMGEVLDSGFDDESSALMLPSLDYDYMGGER